jgi:hypothetical protein
MSWRTRIRRMRRRMIVFVSHQTLARREEFELSITEDPPTPEQLKSILEYIGTQRASTIVKGAKDKAEAMKNSRKMRRTFRSPSYVVLPLSPFKLYRIGLLTISTDGGLEERKGSGWR